MKNTLKSLPQKGRDIFRFQQNGSAPCCPLFTKKIRRTRKVTQRTFKREIDGNKREIEAYDNTIMMAKEQKDKMMREKSNFACDKTKMHEIIKT